MAAAAAACNILFTNESQPWRMPLTLWDASSTKYQKDWTWLKQ